MYRRDRINERDVPESQHTIFIRGLPGAMTTEEIRSFFANDGTCSFDFVKVSPDRTKLYVAVRFDSKNSAREVMEKYGKDGRGEILGHEVELSWFRDIRRYIAHCAKQGIAPSRFNSSGGSSGGRRVFRNDDGYRPRGRRSRSVSPLRTTRTRSRSSQQNSNHSQSRSRSNSMSPDENDDDRRRSAGSRSRSPTGEPDDRGRRSRSPSKSVSSVASSGGRSDRHKSADYSDIKKERSPTPPPIKRSKQKKKEKKAERKRRRHHHQSPSQSPVHSDGHGGGGGGMDGGSDMEASEGEIVPSPKGGGGKNGKAPSASMMITSSKSIGPNKPPEAFYQQQILQKQQQQMTVVAKQEQQQRQSPPKTYTLRNIPDGSVATNQNNVKSIKNEVAMLAAAAVTNTQQNQQVQPDSSSGYGIGGGQNSTTNNNSKFRQTLFTVDLDNPSNVTTKYSSINGSAKAEDMMAKRPRLDASPSNVQSSAASATIRNSAPLTSSSPLRESGPLAGSVFKDIQRQILQDVRYKPQPDAEEENLGGLRLSALSRQRMTDDMREEKVAKLSPEMRERVAKKKRQLELSYRHDCETFGLVTRKLIEKDRTLEDRLKLALLDTMKDLEGETLKQLDEFLDQLSFIY